MLTIIYDDKSKSALNLLERPFPNSNKFVSKFVLFQGMLHGRLNVLLVEAGLDKVSNSPLP